MMPAIVSSISQENKRRYPKGERILVIDGGGIKIAGAAIGVLKVLQKYFQEEGIHIDRIVGISGGSIIAALYALGRNYSQITKLLLHYWTRSLFKDINPFIINGVFRGDAIERNLQEAFANATFSETRIPLSIMAGKIGFSSVDAEVIEDGYIHEALRASIAIPFLFRPKRIKGVKYYDGSVALSQMGDVIDFFHPREMYSIELDEVQITLYGICNKIFGALLRKKSLFKKQKFSEKESLPRIVHRIRVPISSHVRLWGVEHLPFLILEGEKAAKSFLNEELKKRV